jgi:hypothetical protein
VLLAPCDYAAYGGLRASEPLEDLVTIKEVPIPELVEVGLDGR